MAEFVTPEELGAAMNELLGELCDRVRASKESKNTALRDDILPIFATTFGNTTSGWRKSPISLKFRFRTSAGS